MYVSYDLATPLQGVCPTEMCVYIHHKKCIVFVEALLIIPQPEGTQKRDEWIINR